MSYQMSRLLGWEWMPLLRVVGEACAGQFVFLGRIAPENQPQVTLFIYKHRQTREHLNLSADGTRWHALAMDRYEPMLPPGLWMDAPATKPSDLTMDLDLCLAALHRRKVDLYAAFPQGADHACAPADYDCPPEPVPCGAR